MKIAIHTLGTRGDVQPYVALALGLKAAGHDVLLVAPEQFARFIGDRDLAFAGLPAEFLELLETPEAKSAISKNKGFGAGFKLLKHVKPLMLKMFDADWAAAENFKPEIIVYHPKNLAAPLIAEHLDIPSILASPLPGFTPTSAFPSPMLPFSSVGPLNRVSHSLMVHSAGILFGGTMRAWRAKTFGVEERRRRAPMASKPTLYAYSPTVVPVPPDWGRNVLVSGYWFLDDASGWEPSPNLAAFLSSGSPPIYVGFGSMPIADPAAMTATILEALAKAGRRAVISSGWGGLGTDALPDNVHLVNDAPHDQLFPLVDAVLHHGGAGSTAAGLRAGKPTVICSFLGDQPFWGRRVAALGAGPPLLQQKGLTADRLAEAIVRVTTDPQVRARAQSLGKVINSEKGMESAVAFIEQAPGHRPP